MLNDFCKQFDINIVLYKYDEKQGKILKANRGNGYIFGDKNASLTFNIASFENHYFIYEDVPIRKYDLNNREVIIERRIVKSAIGQLSPAFPLILR